MDFTHRQTILIVDDSELNRALLIDMLGDEYNILEAADGEEAIAIVKKQGLGIDLMLLDIIMPKMDGFGVLNIMNYQHWIDGIPVVVISAETQWDTIERAYELGVTEFISRPFDPLIVRRRVLNTLLLYAKQRRLMNLVSEQIYKKECQSDMMIDILSHLVEFRNGESGQHVRNIHILTDLLLHYLQQVTDRYPMTAEQMNTIIAASALHDIGKIAIPSEVLNKPGRLTKDEYRAMQRHTLIGADMMTTLPIYKDEPLVKAAYEICRWHHERYDGSGYPDGLRGDEIPISAQVVALADVYDALTSTRIYKRAYTHQEAVKMILSGECGVFNPLLLSCLNELADRLPEEIHRAIENQGIDREIHAIAEEVQQHEELSVSSRTLQMLEHERLKTRFFADMSGEIQFEFTMAPPMLTLTAFSAGKLGLDEVIINPLKDKRILNIMNPEDVQGLSDALHASIPEQPVVQYECLLKIDGEERWGRIIARAIWTEGSPPRYMGAIGKSIDIHDEHIRMSTLEWLSTHDSLTGLFNHAAARERIIERMALRPHSTFDLLIFDMDDFKGINDTHGHLFGDMVLCQTAERLRHCVRSGDIIARVGGDEYLVFLEYKGDDYQIIQRILRQMTFSWEQCAIGVSVGVARTELLGSNYEALFHAADQALYAAKAAGGGQVCFYREEMKDMLSALSVIEESGKLSGMYTRTKEAHEN